MMNFYDFFFYTKKRVFLLFLYSFAVFSGLELNLKIRLGAFVVNLMQISKKILIDIQYNVQPKMLISAQNDHAKEKKPKIKNNIFVSDCSKCSADSESVSIFIFGYHLAELCRF